MKELSIEEKAKAYDEVREKIAIRFGSNIAKEIFSEYEESEDERIRKGLIEYFLHYPDHEITYYGLKADFVIAWLEKQGEQNLVKHFCDCVYVGCHINDCKRWCHSYQKEISYTACNSNCNRYSKPVNHAFNIGETITDGISAFKIADIKGNHYIADDGERVEIYMAHRYYTTIQNQGEQKPADKVEPKFKTGDRVIGIASGMQYYITEICDDYYNTESGCTIMFCAQDNFELSKQEPTWSEEDKEITRSLLDIIYECHSYGKCALKLNEYSKLCDWLKSLKPQKQWKPSEEQIRRLEYFVKLWGKTEDTENTKVFETVKSLLNDLKQLRQL